MADVFKYRIWCETESAYVYAWRDSDQGAPSACPNDPAHTITAGKTTIVESAGVSAPTKDDGTPYVANAPAKPGSPLFPVGIAKKITLPAATPVAVDYQLQEDRYLNGAHGEVWGNFVPGEGGDYVEFFVIAPDGQGGEIVVGQFGETLYLGESGLIGPFVSEESTKVPAGCKFRAIYHATGSSGEVNLVGWIRTYKEPSA